jgi:hypothetical protein
MVADMYSKILLDNPSPNPGLKFEAYASALKNIIEISDPQFSIGIFGGWGSGKTTLMQAIKKKLNDQTVSVWFNAWRYEKEEHLIIPLLDTLRDALVTWAEAAEDNAAIDPSFKDRAIKAASTISKAARAIFAGMAIKASLPVVEVSLDANKAVAEWRQGNIEVDRKDAESPQSAYHASFKALQDSLSEFTQHGEQRIVVFIDDLDRCLPVNALQVLESMKLFFDLEGFVFVVGLDQKVIEASINWNYRLSSSSDASAAGPPIDGAEYIKKLFQVPFNLPAVSSGQLGDYLEAVFWNADEAGNDQVSLLRSVQPHLEALVGNSEMNPREIKRYINSFILQKLIRPELDDDVTLVLQTIAFRPDWSDAYQIFRSKPDAFTEAAKLQLDGQDSALKDLDPRLETLPESFFQYISSKGGHKLLTLDAPQLKEQVRSFEETQSPGNPLIEQMNSFSSFGQLVEQQDLLELAQNEEAANSLRSRLRNLSITTDELLKELRPRGPGERSVIEEIATLNSRYRDMVDRLGFMLRRGAEMNQEDFNNLLVVRSELADLMRGIAQRIGMSLQESP